MEFIQNVVNGIENRAFAKFSYKNIYSDQELERIMALCNAVPKETVTIGDLGEENNLEVGRFVEDLDEQVPVVRNMEFSEKLLGIINNERAKSLFRTIMSGDYYIRRCQVNKMKKGSFVTKHQDTHSNYSYVYSFVMQLENDFSGGEFVIYHNNKKEVILPKKGDVLINKSDALHEVQTVKSGNRMSLVFFMSKQDYNMPNKENVLV